MAERVAILCYHRVHADDDPAMPAVEENCAHVTASVFSKQMAALAKQGFAVVNHSQICDWIEGKADLPAERNVAIDFDDNRLNVVENAFPIMEEYGYKATMFFITALADGKLPHMETYPWIGWDHLAQLVEAGWTAGAHTVTHAFLTDLYAEDGGPEKVAWELAHCQQAMQQRLGADVPNFTCPNGRTNDQVEVIIKKHFRTNRLWQTEGAIRYNTRNTNPYRLEAYNMSLLLTDDDFQQILQGVC